MGELFFISLQHKDFAMKKNLLLAVFLLFSAGAFAQIIAINPNYSDTTKYKKPIVVPSDTTHYKRESPAQSKVYIFFDSCGYLTATQPKGRVVHFTWQQLDTTTLAFNQIWSDTAPHNSTNYISSLPDSVGYGCYRVLTDTLKTGSGGVDEIVAADTFTAWVFIDTFRIDSIVKESQDCNFLNLQVRFYPPSVNEGSFYYSYIDLWQTPKRIIRQYPDRPGYQYIDKVTWETSVDIYKNVPGDFTYDWSYSPYIPTPYYDAIYKVTVTNYFGHQASNSTDLIEAMSTYAKMKLYVDKETQGWVEKTDDSGEESPATIKLVNTSINAPSDSSTFIWSLFTNLYELPDNIKSDEVPLIVPQIETTDSSKVIYPADYNPTLYQPGKYPIALYVQNKYGCYSSDTIYFEVDEFLLNKDAIPTVFTPNGDGKNDEFKLKDPDQNVQSLQSIEVHIFNRYGQLMYSSSDVLFSWDGKMRNTNIIAPDGVYFYVLKASGLNKQRKAVKQTYKGNVHLFKGQQ